jgi:hypothetical protein
MWRPPGPSPPPPPLRPPRPDRRRAPLGAAVALGLAALAAGGCAAGPRSAAAPPPTPVAAPVETVYPDQGHDHIPLPAFPHAPYLSEPPASGPHTPYTAPWGIHTKPVPDEILIHNLEHGGVVLGYRCMDCPEVAAGLARLAAGYPLVVVAPNPKLPAPIVLSAWQHTLRVQALNDEARWAIRAFLARYHGVDHHLRGHVHAAPARPAPPGMQR